jgi:hypothetical protein
MGLPRLGRSKKCDGIFLETMWIYTIYTTIAADRRFFRTSSTVANEIPLRFGQVMQT